MKLAKKHANTISSAFNSIVVAKHMIAKGYEFELWGQKHDEAIEILREYGIDMGSTYAEIEKKMEAGLAI